MFKSLIAICFCLFMVPTYASGASLVSVASATLPAAPYSITSDASGNTYVATTSHVYKYDANCNYTGWSMSDGNLIVALAFDKTSNSLYLVDFYYVYKVNVSAKTVTWSYALPYTGRGCAVDTSGNLYITMYNNSGGPSTGNAVMKLTSAGGVAWGPVGSFNDGPFYITYDKVTDSVVFCGTLGWLYKYSSGGGLIWSTRSGTLSGVGVATDSSGRVFVGTWGGGVKAYTSSGGALWAVTTAYSAVSAVAIDPNGDLFIGLRTTPGAVSKISGANGSLIESCNVDPYPDGIVVDSTGLNIYVIDQTNFTLRRLVQICNVPRSFPAANPSVSASSSKVKASDFTNLLANINYLRADAFLGNCPAWSSGSTPTSGTKIKASDINDLRSCLASVYSTCYGSCGAAGGCSTFNVSATAGVTKIKASDIQDLVTGVNSAP